MKTRVCLKYFMNENINITAHYRVYLPRINKHLSVFGEGLDSHHLRTKSNITPNQVWIYSTPMYKDDEIMVDVVKNGIDWSGPWLSAKSGINFGDSVNIP